MTEMVRWYHLIMTAYGFWLPNDPRRHARTIEEVATHLKSKATMALTRAKAHPLNGYQKRNGTIPTPWGVGIWSAFINDAEQLRAAIRYVERHPTKKGLAPQNYPFIVPPKL
jgi:hypothetical protein